MAAMQTEPRTAEDPTLGRPRILFLIDEMAAITAGGTERQLLQLVGIAKTNGFAPSIGVLRGTQWLIEEVAGCPVAHFQIGSVRSSFGIAETWRLVRWARAQRFRILQTFFAESNLIGPWIGKLAGIPIILGTRRNLKHATNDGPGAATRLQWLSNCLVNEIIVNAAAVARATAATEWLSARKIRVVYNGIDLDALQLAPGLREATRAQLGIGENDLLVGNISGLRAIKGVELFVEAAAMARQREARLKFVLVGEGEMRPTLKAAIVRHNLQDTFRLVGAAEDVRPYLAAMDIAVLCSSAEGFSNSLLEYMAVGLPIIATDVGGNREALDDAGMLIPPNDATALCHAILALIDPQKRRDLGARALHNVQRFSIAEANRQMGNLFRSYVKNEIKAP